jgi:hypothetical protein
MGEYNAEKREAAAVQHAATRYAADRVWDLREMHPDLTISKLLALLENDAHEALVEVESWDALKRV